MLENLSIMLWASHSKNPVTIIGFDMTILPQKKQIPLLWLHGTTGKKISPQKMTSFETEYVSCKKIKLCRYIYFFQIRFS